MLLYKHDFVIELKRKLFFFFFFVMPGFVNPERI